jgi:hypothetical protein
MLDGTTDAQIERAIEEGRILHTHVKRGQRAGEHV